MQNMKFIPPSLRVTPNISFRIKPDRICPRVYLVDQNKDKFTKRYLNKHPMPRGIMFDPNWGKLPQDEVFMEYLQ